MRSHLSLFAVSALVVASQALAGEPAPRDRAKTLLVELDRKGASRGAARDAVAEARRALERADKARLAGDQKHGAELEALALEWAEAGRDLARTAEAEEHAAGLEKKLTETEVKLRTTRTLIEQAAARRARADAELAELKQSAASPAPSVAPATTPKTAPSAAPTGTPKTAPPAAPTGTPKTPPSATPAATPKTAPTGTPKTPPSAVPAPAQPKAAPPPKAKETK